MTSGLLDALFGPAVVFYFDQIVNDLISAGFRHRRRAHIFVLQVGQAGRGCASEYGRGSGREDDADMTAIWFAAAGDATVGSRLTTDSQGPA
jgi:hypothetical protein